MNYKELEKKYIMQTYQRQDIVIKNAKDKYVWDINGKKYLDFFMGISVCNLGHCNSKVVKAIEKQSRLLVHGSNHYYLLPQIELAKILIEKSFKKGKVFFSNSGAEANECAIKLARKLYRGKYEIITFKKSFHGRTLATISATGQEKMQAGFEPLVDGFSYADLNDITSVKKLISEKTCAVMIEPVQGEGGINIAKREFVRALRALCDDKGLLLIFDEIQCGLGRMGKLFAYQYYGFEPDVITLAKSIANGLPLGVTLVKEKYENLLSFGEHGTTFGGNPVSCAAAIEVVKCMSDKKVLDNVEKMGEYLSEVLTQLKNKYPKIIKEIRGVGLMVGMELFIEGADIVKKCAEKGLIINCTNKYTLRFLPPLTIKKRDIDFAVGILEKTMITTETRKSGNTEL